MKRAISLRTLRRRRQKGAVVEEVHLPGGHHRANLVTPMGAPRSYRVFATREEAEQFNSRRREIERYRQLPEGRHV